MKTKSVRKSPKPAAASLPPAVTRYLAAANRHDPAAAARCFGPDARVHDEGQDHLGRDAVRAWVAATSRKYRPKFELLRARGRGAQWIISVGISGQFPGSPIQLDYKLTVHDGKISTLEIQ